MEATHRDPVPVFLQGGGEMGSLMRNYDWAFSSLGPFDRWPQSLRTTLSILLNSQFPMFLFWGPDLICFYNDAFRPSLGNEGKHPWALGKRGQDVWEEIWPTVKPWIDQVLSGGESVWNEDQLMPYFRNGRIEDTYWTFSYSPVYDESGRRAGVFVTCTETTEKVETLRRLKTANERFEKMVLQAPVAIAVFRGEELVAEIANDTYLPLAGKTREEFVGKPLFESLPETRETLEPIVRKLLKTGEPYFASEFEIEVCRNGQVQSCFFNFVYEPLYEPDGRIDGFIVVGHEITEQVMARKRAEESEARFRLMADTMPQFVWTSDPEGNLDYFNKAVMDYSGLSFEQIRKDGWTEIVHPDDREENKRLWRHAVATGEDFLFRHRFRNWNGVYRWQLSRAVPLKDAAGRVQLWIGTSTDIHEQKMFEEELNSQVLTRTYELEAAKESLLQGNQYLQEIINKFESALVTLEPIFEDEALVDFRIRMTNAVYAGYARRTPEELKGQKLSDVFPGYYQTEAFNKYRETYESGHPEDWELHYKQDGLDVYLQVTVSRMGGELVVQWLDYTVLKNLQLDLLRKIGELERSNRNLEDFAYAASHDLKEPIRKIHFFSERLKSQLKESLDSVSLRLFSRLEASTERMRTLVDDLLSYSQVSIRPRMYEEVDLQQVVNLVFSDLELQIEEKNAEVFTGSLPIVRGHMRQLQQLFQNVLGNALKYSKPGEPPVIAISSCSIKGAESGMPVSSDQMNQDFYLIEVSDNGIGFDPQDAERIFQVFQRLHGNSEYGGTGVGLAIARKVAENHNGYITSTGEEGKGATFRILLPA